MLLSSFFKKKKLGIISKFGLLDTNVYVYTLKQCQYFTYSGEKKTLKYVQINDDELIK